jgi:hypothetical protein
MRIAVISTPRAGNTWVRRVLSQALDLENIAVHNPRDIPSVLPDRVALQIHWYREPNFQAFLQDNGFRIVTVARHPLDVLISALRFLPHEPLTARWLEGNAEIPSDLSKHAPASERFLEYATSWGAENLLSISYLWWHEPTAIKLRYEDLVREPVSGFSSAVEGLGGSVANVRVAVEANPLKALQDTPNRHAWQGRAGLWRELIPPRDARRIYSRHRRVFETLGYRVSPPQFLSRHTALRNWERLLDR